MGVRLGCRLMNRLVYSLAVGFLFRLVNNLGCLLGVLVASLIDTLACT